MWVGSHGSLSGVKISIEQETDDGHVHPIRTWTKKDGEELPAVPPHPIADQPGLDTAVTDVT